MTKYERMRRTLIAYDVPDDKRRYRVAKTLERYGDRIQYSVFVVDLLPYRLVELRSTLEEILDRKSDSVLLCDLGPCASLTDKQFSYLGQRRQITNSGPIII